MSQDILQKMNLFLSELNSCMLGILSRIKIMPPRQGPRSNFLSVGAALASSTEERGLILKVVKTHLNQFNSEDVFRQAWMFSCEVRQLWPTTIIRYKDLSFLEVYSTKFIIFSTKSMWVGGRGGGVWRSPWSLGPLPLRGPFQSLICLRDLRTWSIIRCPRVTWYFQIINEMSKI